MLTKSGTMRSPILAFFSPPFSPTHAPTPVPSPTTIKSEPQGSNVTLFTRQDGKDFQVTIVRLDETAELDSDNVGNYREEDWDSDDWDEDAEDWAEPVGQQYSQTQLHLRSQRKVMEGGTGKLGKTSADREDHRTVDDWDGDAQDLEERPVAKWSERPERPDWVKRERDADVWRTRLGDD